MPNFCACALIVVISSRRQKGRILQTVRLTGSCLIALVMKNLDDNYWHVQSAKDEADMWKRKSHEVLRR